MPRFTRCESLLGDEWWLPLIRGGIALLFACFAFGMPVATIGTLLLVVAGYLLSDAVVLFCAARAVGPDPPALLLRVEAFVAVVVGWLAIAFIVVLLTFLAWSRRGEALVTALVILLLAVALFIAAWTLLTCRTTSYTLVMAALLPLPTFFLVASFLFGPVAHAMIPWEYPVNWTLPGAVFPEGLVEFIYGIPALDGVAGPDGPLGFIYRLSSPDRPAGFLPPLTTLRWVTLTLRWVTLVIVLWLWVRGFLLLKAAAHPIAGRPVGASGWWLISSAGLVALTWGVLLKLYVEPEPSALMEWLGAYLLLFGMIMVALALRLRTQPHRGDALDPFTSGISLRRMAALYFGDRGLSQPEPSRSRSLPCCM
jgi:uncharacterized membrane protein HdeD (DUF308 family)